MVIWLLIGAASADPAADPPFVAPGETIRATVPSFLVPEAVADRCLVLQEEASIWERKLLKCERVAADALAGASTELAAAYDTITVLGAERDTAIADNAVLLTDNQRLKRQRNTAYLITASSAAALLAGLAIAL